MAGLWHQVGPGQGWSLSGLAGYGKQAANWMKGADAEYIRLANQAGNQKIQSLAPLIDYAVPQTSSDVLMSMLPVPPVGKLLKSNLVRATGLHGAEAAEKMALGWAEDISKKVRGAKELFSEMGPDLFMDLMSTGQSRLWSTANKNLALGQGMNRGIKIKFDPNALGVPHETLVRRKPGAMSDADLEYESYVSHAAMREGISEIAIAPGTKMRPVQKTLFNRFTKGWNRTKGGDGWTVFTRPE